MPLGDPLPGILEQLRDEAPERRVAAARRLAGWEQVPETAATTLVLALEDADGVVPEDWVDWDGGVADTLVHRVPRYAAEALGRCGPVGLDLAAAAAYGGAAGARAELFRVVLTATADDALALGREARARARPFLAPGEAAESLLRELADATFAWSDGEEARGETEWQRAAGRLGHPRYQVARRAAQRLGDCPDRVWAAASLADALLLGEIVEHAQLAAGRSLAALGPVLDPRRLQVLLEAARDHRPLGALGPVFLALAAHGRPAAPLVPALKEWLRPRFPRELPLEAAQAIRRDAAEALAVLEG